MAVKVIKFRVRAGGKTYFPGDIISSLDAITEKTLIEDGFCEAVLVVVETEGSVTDDERAKGSVADKEDANKSEGDMQSTPPKSLLTDKEDNISAGEANDNDDGEANDDDGGPSTGHPLAVTARQDDLAQKDRQELQAIAKELPGYNGKMSKTDIIALILAAEAK